MATDPFAGASTTAAAPVVVAPPKPKAPKGEYTVKDKPPFKGLLGDALGALSFWGTAAMGGARDFSKMLVGQKPDVRFQFPGQSNPPPPGAPGPAGATPSLEQQIAGLKLPAGLAPQGSTSGLSEYLTAVQSVAGSKLPQTVKDQLTAMIGQNYQTQQSQAAQAPAKLAYQAFYNNTVLPYLQNQQGQANATLNPLFAQMQSNISSLPQAYQGASQESLDALQAGSAMTGEALQQNALNQPLLSQLLTSISSDIAAQQAAQKAYAQSGAVNTAQSLAGALPSGTSISVNPYTG